MSVTDTLELNKTQMFEKIRGGISAMKTEQRQYSQNLIDCKDDLLFAWNASDNSILVVNWRVAQAKGIAHMKYQTLIPSVPQNFHVDRIICSNECSLIAVAGPRGVAILELPRRWGQHGLFMEGKSRIICRCHILDEQLFANVPHLEVHQLRWHPASPTDSHLLVLLSDNNIRVYDNAVLRHVWRVGPLPSKRDANANSSIVDTMQALGETVVDFDFAPAINIDDSAQLIYKQEEDLYNSNRNLSASLAKLSISKAPHKVSDKVVWPLVLLRENGNVYILLAGLVTDRPRLQGPLTITPQTGDNYGLDSCAILVIPSLPPTLVIAETNGKLHHALLLDADVAEDSFNEMDKTLNIYPSEWTVHVLETVELELGLTKKFENNLNYHSPIHLKRDFINELRYFAYHNAGLHVITINFIDELQRFLDANIVASDGPLLNTPSRAEYIVCTKINGMEDRINAVLGFVLLQMPSGVVILLGSGQVVSLKLVIDPKLLDVDIVKGNRNDDGENKSSTNGAQDEISKLLGPSFEDHIKSLLKRSLTQPILSLDKTNGTPSMLDCYELLAQAKEVLRTEYLKRHELVRAEFAKRINTIKLVKEQQIQEIEELQNERQIIRERAHSLADRFEEIKEKQQVLTKKCQDLMRTANTCLPANHMAEKNFASNVKQIQEKTQRLMKCIEDARETIKKQNEHMSKCRSRTQTDQFTLASNQERLIKEILVEMEGEIRSQVRECKRLNATAGAS